MLKVGAATVLYAVVHSFFASRVAKDRARRIAGDRYRNALYRPFYLAQSAVAMALLVRYVRSLPTKEIYRLRGPAAWALRTGQAVGLVWATSAAYEVDFAEILGIRGVTELSAGKMLIGPEPEAQGPAPRDSAELRVAGPFRLSRHPLNLAPLPIMWLNPRMTTNLLAFNLLGTVYLVLGSWHEEVRLRDVYGEAYREYQRSRVPFYLPVRSFLRI